MSDSISKLQAAVDDLQRELVAHGFSNPLPPRERLSDYTYDTYVERKVTIHYDYQPYEEPKGNYPGCDAEVVINKMVTHDMTQDEQDVLMQEVMDQHNDREYRDE